MDDATKERFEQAAAALRPELLAHCYRLLGSYADAEDQVQEAYLRAWRAFHAFEGRSSVRTWMYTIATNTCLSAKAAASRRVLPTGLGGPPADPRTTLVEDRDTRWVEPLPDAVLWSDRPPDPAEASLAREGIELAVITALQELPPRQRAALVLRDVLAFSAQEAADILSVTVPACNSALQRARERMGGTGVPGRRSGDLSDHDREVYHQFLAAFEEYDVPAMVEVLAEDATWQMPPFTFWYRGRQNIGDLVRMQCPATGPGSLRMLPCQVNAQPAAGMYLRHADGVHRAFQLLVLQLDKERVAAVVGFVETATFPLAGLPPQLPEGPPARG